MEKQLLKPFISDVINGVCLSQLQAEQAFGYIMNGEATAAQIAAFLVALRIRGESVDEITGAAMAIRARARTIVAPSDAMDIVGTGGDGVGTLNISTATALVVAACGVPVAKHGNKAVSSQSGTADVQSALGINVQADFAVLEKSLACHNFAFLLAPRHHESFRHVGPVRAELGIRTIFNILGPLCNPANVQRILLGVYSQEWVRPLAETLFNLGCQAAWVVHGAGGLDELSTLGENTVCAIENGKLKEFTVSPEEAGLSKANLADILGGDAAYNAGELLNLLQGVKGAYRDIVLFNSAAALMIAGKSDSLREGCELAARAIDSGKALAVVQGLRELTV
jgi:anthranilate phosphoribosyltransferase